MYTITLQIPDASTLKLFAEACPANGLEKEDLSTVVSQKAKIADYLAKDLKSRVIAKAVTTSSGQLPTNMGIIVTTDSSTTSP